ncbi:MAG: hypothetical protein Q7K57_54380 [Burkholderiaceae bacterium]|nr:hypothetical protein [Burkholderiaceae bacterium]
MAKKVFDILLHPIEVAMAELTHLIGLRADFDIALIMPILTYFSQLAMSRTLGSRPRNLRVRAIFNRWPQHPKSRKTLADGRNVDHVQRSNKRHHRPEAAVLADIWSNMIRCGLVLFIDAADLLAVTCSCRLVSR